MTLPLKALVMRWGGGHGGGVYRGLSRRLPTRRRWWAAAVPVLAVGFVLVVGTRSMDVFSGEMRERLESHSFGNLDEAAYRLRYPALAGLKVDGHVVPGLHANFVPQGVDYLPGDTHRAVISGYFCQRFERAPLRRALISQCGQKQSALYLVDLDNGKALRLAMLEERDGEPMRRHAGGVAILHERVWLPDNFELLRFDLDKLLTAWRDVITLQPENERRIGVDSSGDFITARGNALDWQLSACPARRAFAAALPLAGRRHHRVDRRLPHR